MPKDFNILSDDCDIDIAYKKDDIFMRENTECIDFTPLLNNGIYGDIINENYTLE